MSEAPERICVTWPNPRGCGLAFTAESKKGTEYVRADRIAALEAEVARLRDALTELVTVAKRAQDLSNRYLSFNLSAMEPFDAALKTARAALGDATP